MTSILLSAFSTVQLISIVLILVLLQLGFRLLETNWSYRISKPYAWEEAIRKGQVSVKVKRMERFYRDKVRFYMFWFQLRRLEKDQVSGALAEVGVYKGETAKIIHAIDPSRRFYLFDTFEGFAPEDLSQESGDREKFKTTDFSDTSLDSVKQFVNGNENVIYYPGHFPDTTRQLPEEIYAMVHLDADLYQPTLEGLKYFYPRLSPGGAIIVHDYNHDWEGVSKAVDEFIKTIPEPLSWISDWQGSVMIVRSMKDK